jgi:hypothetical protein
METTQVPLVQEGAAVHVLPIEKNTVTVSLEQDTVKFVTRKGVQVEKPVKHHMAFSDSVEAAVSSENVANFIIAKLFQYQEMQRLQGNKAKFDTSLPINMSISVNGKERESKLKFSTNAKTLARLLETTPKLMGWIYNPTNLGLLCKAEDILTYAKGLNVIIAKAIEHPDEAANLLENGAVDEIPAEPAHEDVQDAVVVE